MYNHLSAVCVLRRTLFVQFMIIIVIDGQSSVVLDCPFDRNRLPMLFLDVWKHHIEDCLTRHPVIRSIDIHLLHVKMELPVYATRQVLSIVAALRQVVIDIG